MAGAWLATGLTKLVRGAIGLVVPCGGARLSRGSATLGRCCGWGRILLSDRGVVPAHCISLDHVADRVTANLQIQIIGFEVTFV